MAAMYGDVENQLKRGPNDLHGISAEQVRLGFIKKVYGIVCAQVTLTAAVAGLCVHGPLRDPLLSFVAHRPQLFHWGTLIASMASLAAVSMFQKSYPANLYALGVFTSVMALDVGVVCAMVSAAGLGALVVHAAVLTALITAGLTLYAFRSKRDFSFLGAILYPMLFSLVIFQVLSVFFPSLRMGLSGLLTSFAGALIFCGYIVFDTWRIVNYVKPDNYAEAAIQLYLDIVNLFLYILKILVKLSKERDR
eukprot:gb/GFBE01021874.1/.p1 GENE.gb/GFBE01021874.1/~~gb/GFBE01021874.1/.p1  ORF type:complete len:250 (+),score=43.11 gb/GFBE01021874.1/:1-750(+)